MGSHSESIPQLTGALPRPLPPARPATVEPVGPARFRVRFDATKELRDKLERLQALDEQRLLYRLP